MQSIRYSSQKWTKNEFSQQIFWNSLNIIFYFLFISQNIVICLKTFSGHVDSHY